MNPKVQDFEVPGTNLKYSVKVNPDNSWVAYIYNNNQLDWANPIYKLSNIHKKIRQGVTLYIDKCKKDFEANKVS